MLADEPLSSTGIRIFLKKVKFWTELGMSATLLIVF